MVVAAGVSRIEGPESALGLRRRPVDVVVGVGPRSTVVAAADTVPMLGPGYSLAVEQQPSLAAVVVSWVLAHTSQHLAGVHETASEQLVGETQSTCGS